MPAMNNVSRACRELAPHHPASRSAAQIQDLTLPGLRLFSAFAIAKSAPPVNAGSPQFPAENSSAPGAGHGPISSPAGARSQPALPGLLTRGNAPTKRNDANNNAEITRHQGAARFFSNAHKEYLFDSGCSRQVTDNWLLT